MLCLFCLISLKGCCSGAASVTLYNEASTETLTTFTWPRGNQVKSQKKKKKVVKYEWKCVKGIKKDFFFFYTPGLNNWVSQIFRVIIQLMDLWSSKSGPLFFQVFKGEFQLPEFLKEQPQVQLHVCLLLDFIFLQIQLPALFWFESNHL